MPRLFVNMNRTNSLRTDETSFSRFDPYVTTRSNWGCLSSKLTARSINPAVGGAPAAVSTTEHWVVNVRLLIATLVGGAIVGLAAVAWHAYQVKSQCDRVLG